MHESKNSLICCKQGNHANEEYTCLELIDIAQIEDNNVYTKKFFILDPSINLELDYFKSISVAISLKWYYV